MMSGEVSAFHSCLFPPFLSLFFLRHLAGPMCRRHHRSRGRMAAGYDSFSGTLGLLPQPLRRLTADGWRIQLTAPLTIYRYSSVYD